MKRNGEFKIEQGIEIPERRGGAVIAPAMRAMKKGDSILLHNSPATARSQAHLYLGKGNYTVRESKEGVRVWRTR